MADNNKENTAGKEDQKEAPQSKENKIEKIEGYEIPDPPPKEPNKTIILPKLNTPIKEDES